MNRSNRSGKTSSTHELLTTSVLTAVGTAALVGIHHRYRKQQHPDASLQDYVDGICTQLQVLRAAHDLTPKLLRLRYACEQAAATWKQAYHAVGDDKSNTPDFATVHTTTMLARQSAGSVASHHYQKIMPHSSQNEHDFGVVGIDADRQIVWQTTMPERVHDIVVQPLPVNIYEAQTQHSNVDQRRDVVVMGRRPSEKFWVLNTSNGQVQHAITADVNRHFYGHACYSLDGSLLYVTENDTVSLAGKIGIYDARDAYQRVAEFDSYGIGPHELIMHPDSETLVIANGGIKTEQASREELNLDTMRPSLVYLNRHDGTLLEQVTPEHNQMSVRHLTMHDDGTVMIGIQFQGEKHINVPLVLTHKRGDASFTSLTMPNNQWQRFHQYIASVAVDSERNLLCVTTPIGGRAAIYDLHTRELIDDVSLPDCAGASVLANSSASMSKIDKHAEPTGFIVSDGQGQLTALRVNALPEVKLDVNDIEPHERIIKDSQLHMMSFDNHLQAL
ncbi:LOW QUALITY PROTEIN: putative exported protein [Psychrobacter sp. JCM 18900]|nr:LOW QUALITY PROTEIN: putative exported protein [Psychrobacter sp. JCM 18900]